MADLYQVVGNPIAHSQSPAIHRAFAEQTGQDLEYRRLLLDAQNFAEVMSEQLRSGSVKGANVTVPFKELAWQLAEVRSPRAELSGAANTLLLDDQGRILAENTDGPGLVADLQGHQGLSLHGRRVLLLGAGGAVRGVIHSILDAGVSELVLANRTYEKAQLLANLFKDSRIRACRYEALPETPFDLVINGTSASLNSALPAIPQRVIGPQTLAYDMVYGAEPTPFMRWAESQGAQTRDGLGMLVEQAAEAFYLWRGVRPDTTPVLQNLRAQLSHK